MDQVNQVREKIDIVSLISEYLSLKKAGRNFKAVCPFHNEKTPSFVISPERQIWHCFGCGKGGDAFTFLMEYENLEFPEALRILAKKAGVELKDYIFDKGNQGKKEKIYNLNEKAAKFYSYLLLNHSVGKKALDYLFEKRKMNKGLIETFSIGFSPRISSLSNYLINKKKTEKKDLIEAGLSFEIRGRIIDFFKGRIMFPLKDHRGNIVGFSARTFEESSAADGPKYINTKDTPVYHKGELFFGLDLAKEEIKKQNQVIVVEGEFDLISMVKEGIKNVVAIKGTALTENQAILLSRFCQKVTLCLDQDEAGFEAIKRSLAVLEKRGLTTTVILISNGKDPDEAIKNDPIEFKKAVKNEIGVYDYLISRTIAKNNKNKIEGKRNITDELLPILSQIENEIVKEHYLKLLSKEIEVSYESLIKQVQKIQSGKKEEGVFIKRKDKKIRKEILEEYFLSLVIQGKNQRQLFQSVNTILSNYSFQIPAIKRILDYLINYFKNIEEFDHKKFSSALPKELLPTFDACYIFPISDFENLKKYSEELEKVVKEMVLIDGKEKIKIISEKLKKAKQENNLEITEALEKELSLIISKLPKNI